MFKAEGGVDDSDGPIKKNYQFLWGPGIKHSTTQSPCSFLDSGDIGVSLRETGLCPVHLLWISEGLIDLWVEQGNDPVAFPTTLLEDSLGTLRRASSVYFLLSKL